MKSFPVLVAVAVLAVLGQVDAETPALRRLDQEPAALLPTVAPVVPHGNNTINGIRGKWCDRWPFYCNYRQLTETEAVALPTVAPVVAHGNNTINGIRGKWCDRWPFYCNY